MRDLINLLNGIARLISEIQKTATILSHRSRV